MSDSPRVVLLGAGGHARVLIDALVCGGFALPDIALDSDPQRVGQLVDGVRIAGGDELLASLIKEKFTHFVLGMAGRGNSPLRMRIFEKAVAAGLHPFSVIHPKAIISGRAKIGEGCQILGNAVVNPGALLGVGCIANTSSVVEHDVNVGDFSHIAPCACVAGGVVIGRQVHIGLGAVIREGLSIGEGSLVGAGAVVVDDVPPFSLAVGVPARFSPLC